MTRKQYTKNLSDVKTAFARPCPGSDREKRVGHAPAGHDLLVDCAPQCRVRLRWLQSPFRGL